MSWLYEHSNIVTAFGLYETFNLCAAEGLFYGKPLVLSNSGPHPELINDNGFLVDHDENEVNEFAAKIKKIHDDEALYRKMSINGKKHWKNYDYESTINAHEKYFMESSKNNLIKNRNYITFIKYLAFMGVIMNTFLLTMSLKEKKDNGLIEEFEKFTDSMNSEVRRLKKSF